MSYAIIDGQRVAMSPTRERTPAELALFDRYLRLELTNREYLRALTQLLREAP